MDGLNPASVPLCYSGFTPLVGALRRGVASKPFPSLSCLCFSSVLAGLKPRWPPKDRLVRTVVSGSFQNPGAVTAACGSFPSVCE